MRSIRDAIKEAWEGASLGMTAGLALLTLPEHASAEVPPPSPPERRIAHAGAPREVRVELISAGEFLRVAEELSRQLSLRGTELHARYGAGPEQEYVCSNEYRKKIFAIEANVLAFASILDDLMKDNGAARTNKAAPSSFSGPLNHPESALTLDERRERRTLLAVIPGRSLERGECLLVKDGSWGVPTELLKHAPASLRGAVQQLTRERRLITEVIIPEYFGGKEPAGDRMLPPVASAWVTAQIIREVHQSLKAPLATFKHDTALDSAEPGTPLDL